MDNEKSLDLYNQGKEAWNTWANEMLAKKAKLEEKGLWQTDNVKQTHNQATEEWISESSIHFSGDLFTEEMDFHGFIFPYKVNFYRTKFEDVARFSNAIFNGDINFEYATFNNTAVFRNAKFVGNARFGHTIFSGKVDFANAIFKSNAYFKNTSYSETALFVEAAFSNSADFEKAIFSGETLFNRAKFCANAWFAEVQFNGVAIFDSAEFEENARFHKTTFSQDMLFDQILFKGFADFSRAHFKKKISFIAIHGNGYFSFKDTIFYFVPDFNQAHFIEAPQFDESDFSIAIANRHYDNNGINNISSKWRSLKRLAIQAHDHKSELFFFAEEIKSQRGVKDKAFPDLFNLIWPGGSQYWLGLLYELFSNFGRSVCLPIWWLVFFTTIFFLIYLNPFSTQNEETTQIITSCERTEAAFYLSVRHALPIFFVASHSKKLDQSYDCLYGYGKNQAAIVPNTVICVGVVQTAISTMLVFLILLALRNHFKIK